MVTGDRVNKFSPVPGTAAKWSIQLRIPFYLVVLCCGASKAFSLQTPDEGSAMTQPLLQISCTQHSTSANFA
eukprot:40550-Pelagomonas_calceolata.AAC.1